MEVFDVVSDVELSDVEVFDVASNRLTGPLPLMEGWGQVSSLLLHGNLRQHRPQPRDSLVTHEAPALRRRSLPAAFAGSLCSHAAFAATQPLQPAFAVVVLGSRCRWSRDKLVGNPAGSLCRQSLQAVFAGSLCSQPGSRCRQPLQLSFSAAVASGGRRGTSSSETTAWSYGVESRRGVTAWSHGVEFQRALWPTAPLRVLLAAWGPGLRPGARRCRCSTGNDDG